MKWNAEPDQKAAASAEERRDRGIRALEVPEAGGDEVVEGEEVIETCKKTEGRRLRVSEVLRQ